MANLVQAQSLRFDKLTSTTRLICSQDEYLGIKQQYDRFVAALAVNLEFAEQLGLYDEAYKLYDKLADIEIIEEEGGKDNISKARSVIL